MSNQKQQTFLYKKGQQILTSKGKLGTIAENQLILWGYNNQEGEFVETESFTSFEDLDNFLNSSEIPVDEILDFHIITTPKVLLGTKVFEIEFFNLNTLDNLFPVKVVYTRNADGNEKDNEECIIHLPKDFCLFDCRDKASEKNTLYTRIKPFVEAITGERYYLYILGIYAI